MVFQNNLLAGASGVTGAQAPFDTTLIGNSIWLDGSGTSGDAATDTWGSESNQDRWIWATWYQPLLEIDATGDRNTLFASGSSSNGFSLTHTSTASTFNLFCRDNAGNEGAINTSESYRDLTAWYHILVDFDSANAVANDRISLYVNGVRVGTYSGTAIGQNNHLNTNVSGQTARIGQDLSSTPNNHMQGYLAQTVFLDNKSIANGDLAITDFLDTFTFGTNGSQRIPKSNTDIIALASAAGTNSFCLDYSDANNIVNDASTKGNNFSTSTIAAANQSVHTPSLVYPIMNPLDQDSSTSTTLSEGNLKVSMGTAAGDGIRGTLPYSGKIYWEVEIDSISANSGSHIGIATNNHNLALTADDTSGNGQRDAFVGVSSFSSNLTGFISGSNFDSSYGGLGNNFGTAGKYLMFAVDIDAGKFWGGYDGTWFNSGNPAAGSNDSGKNLALHDKWFPAISRIGSAGSEAFIFNFGQSSFAHTVPTGFESLNSSRLTAPDYQGIDYFDATLYEGNGAGQRVGDFVPFTDAYTVDNSAMFEHDDARYLSRTIETPSSSGGKKGTWSAWFKTANIDTDNVIFDNGTTATNRFSLNMDASGQLIFSHDGTTVLKTSGDFKSDGAWHNVVLKVDTELDPGESGATPNRAIMFIDGVQLTSTDLETTPTNTNIPEDDEIGYMDPGATQFVGSYNGSSANQWDGYLAEVVFLDNQYLNASSFGQLDTSTNRWVPKSVSGLTFGDCGFYLEFEGDFSSTSLGNDAGKDSSGNSNHFAQGGTWATSDQFIDSPSKNYAVYNTVKGAVNTAMSMSEGNLTTKSGNGSVALAQGFPIQDGYWYYEVNFVEDASNMVFGLYNPSTTVTASDSNPSLTGIRDTGIVSLIQNNGGSNSIGLSTSDTGLSNPSAGDVVGIYIRKAENTYGMWFSLNGTAMNNTPAANATATADINFSASIELVPAAHYSNAGTKEAQTNFGQLLQFDGGSTSFDSGSDGNWKHAPVTGFKALNQDNLDDTASKITAWAWIKNRDATDNHILIDRVRGVGKDLHSNADSGTGLAPDEVTNPNTVQRFLQRGVQIGSDVEVNTVNESYVLWQWLVGDSATSATSFSVNSISSGVPNLASTSLVADADHFAIVSYTGAGGSVASSNTIRHGMTGAPEMIWVKERDNANGWIVSSTGIGFNKVVRLDTSDVEGVDDGAFKSTAPTSTLITLGSNSGTNRSSGQMICYAFRSIPGVCKIGTYVGNGDGTGSDTVDGPYVSCGFKPRWIIFKWLTGGSLSSEGWIIKDTVRQIVNPNDDAELFPHGSNAEAAGATHGADILSDGFKIRGGGGAVNKSGATYLYMAMADIGGNGTLPPIYGR